MKKIKNRNSLVIFEELKLKKPTNLREAPNKDELKKIDNIFYDTKNKHSKQTYWIKVKSGNIYQVNQYGELIYSGDAEYQKKIPHKSELKRFRTKVFKHKDITDDLTYWIEDKNGCLCQVNHKDEEVGIQFQIKSWVRDEAIKAVDLNLRLLKKKAYECSKKELMKLIEEEENKIIKKNGWKAVRATALSVLGLSFLPFI